MMRSKVKPKGKGSFTRMCSGCNERKHKAEMLRVVKPKDGEVFVDLSGKAAGRGVYVCKDIKCLQSIMKSRRLSRLLKTEVNNAIYDTLSELITS